MSLPRLLGSLPNGVHGLVLDVYNQILVSRDWEYGRCHGWYLSIDGQGLLRDNYMGLFPPHASEAESRRLAQAVKEMRHVMQSK